MFLRHILSKSKYYVVWNSIPARNDTKIRSEFVQGGISNESVMANDCKSRRNIS